MKSHTQRPKHLKKEKSNELEEIFKFVTEDFDANRYDDVYAIKQKELEAKALELLNRGNFSNERIAKLMAYFLMLYEKHMLNETEVRMTTYSAKEKFEEIIAIEDSTPTGGRPLNEYIFNVAIQTFEEYEASHKGKQPSAIQLSELVGKKLKKLMEKFNSQSSIDLTKSERHLLQWLKQRDSAERNSGNRFYSESTALNHIGRILKQRQAKPSVNTQ